MTTVDTAEISTEEFLEESLRFTHIVSPEDNRARWIQTAQAMFCTMVQVTSQDIVNFCRVNGFAVKALCGYVWVPINDPTKYDTCEACVIEANRRLAEEALES